MVRISQKSLNIDVLEELYSALEGQNITIKRIFDRRFSLSGDDLIIEGEIDELLDNLSIKFPKIVTIRFQVEESSKYEEILEKCSAIKFDHEHHQYYFGSTLVNYEFLYNRLRITEKEKILAVLFRSLLGSKFIPLMPVKIKGVVVLNKKNSSVSFVLPIQQIETLKAWLDSCFTHDCINFDTLVDIYRQTDPLMRKNLDDTIDWINGRLPEIVSKAANIDNIDIVRVYKKTLTLV